MCDPTAGPCRRTARKLTVFVVLWCVASGPLGLAAAESARPIVPGFERFFGGPKADLAQGGRLLLGELNCTSCHRADAATDALLPKQAPILDGIGARVNVAHLRAFIADPHAVKPGTTMPGLFAGLHEAEKKQRVEALVHFLASTGSVHHTAPDMAAAGRGEALFHQVGCFACHGSQKPGAERPADAVPLGDLAEKYSISSLAGFLQEPHTTRPSGRMPDLNLEPKEALEIASYFLKDIKVEPNLRYKYYEGSWQNVPDFTQIEPKQTGVASSFDLGPAPRKDNFGMRFEGFLHVDREGEYTFHAGSDDGSRITIDGHQVVLNDGQHPFTFESGKVRLKPGAHPIAVDYTQGGGEWELRIEFEGPGVPRQALAGAVSIGPERPRKKKGFDVDPALAAKGKELFATVGCASCHELRDGDKLIASKFAAKPLADLKADRGCLSAAPASGRRESPDQSAGSRRPLANVTPPSFHLNERQRAALAAVLRSDVPSKGSSEETIARTMLAMNCYACHSRGGIGGPQRLHEQLFEATIQEMGDEGRIPPPLDGAGDKLRPEWIRRILNEGADDRPYMLARMPKFAANNVGHLVEAFARADAKAAFEKPRLDVPVHRLKSAGRFLVGEKAFSCIKCHSFGPHEATGIQSLDMTKMTGRLREDWFYRYMLRPMDYRPGTRMPTPFPGGISTVEDVLDGDPAGQMVAIWTYLSDGGGAAVPLGLVRDAIVLKPENEPVIYRNFIEGLSPRGIAVGYPEEANLAFDAERFSLSLIWHGAFVDASKHWIGRGPGFQGPLGDHVLKLVEGVPFAWLDSPTAPWPNGSAKEMEYEFRGYRLDKDRRPIFRYRFGPVEIEDFPKPIPASPDTGFRRTLTLKANGEKQPLWYRAAAGAKIEPLDGGWFRIDDKLKTRVGSSGSEPVVRKTGSGFELLLPVAFSGDEVTIEQDYVW